jgi:hypothetical protein
MDPAVQGESNEISVFQISIWADFCQPQAIIPLRALSTTAKAGGIAASVDVGKPI